MKWLLDLIARHGLRLSWSWDLPSFCRGEDCTAKQSHPSNFNDDDAEKLPDIASSRDYKHASEELIRRFLLVANDFYKQTGRTLLITCTYRSPKEQQRLYKQGRFGNPGPIVTQLDGVQKKSKHNFFPSRAVDVCVLDGGKPLWDEPAYWPILPLCKKHGLVHGGSWSKFQDWPHLELPEGIT